MEENVRDKREPPKSIRFSADELSGLSRVSDETGHAVHALVRLAVRRYLAAHAGAPQRAPRRTAAEQRQIALLLAALQEATDAVRAARQSGAGNGSLYLDAAIEALDKLRDGLMVLARRKP